jgi:hypothetical protein
MVVRSLELVLVGAAGSTLATTELSSSKSSWAAFDFFQGIRIPRIVPRLLDQR